MMKNNVKKYQFIRTKWTKQGGELIRKIYEKKKMKGDKEKKKKCQTDKICWKWIGELSSTSVKELDENRK